MISMETLLLRLNIEGALAHMRESAPAEGARKCGCAPTATHAAAPLSGSDAGARRWAIANTLIQTCKLNSIDPLAWLTDVLQRIVSGRTKNHQLHTLLPWNWRQPSTISPT
jgi:hypothetical protein